jgi:hypothetical protein
MHKELLTEFKKGTSSPGFCRVRAVPLRISLSFTTTAAEDSCGSFVDAFHFFVPYLKVRDYNSIYSLNIFDQYFYIYMEIMVYTN